MPTPAEVREAGGVSQPAVSNPAQLLWNLIIRPPRSRYSVQQLGPTYFRVDKRACVRRTDVQLRNPRGHALQCSLFEPMPQGAWERSRLQAAAVDAAASAGEEDGASPLGDGNASSAALAGGPSAASGGGGGGGGGTAASAVIAAMAAARGYAAAVARQEFQEAWEPQPCVVFLHGNSSCRLEALPLVPLLMPLQIALFCFDFSGCGLSEGEYISLGWFERDDLALCVEYLRSLGRISKIAIWGRSMGAFTALLHADRDPSIAGLVLDSPFTSLSLLAEELARGYAKVPGWMVRAVLTVVRSIIQAKAEFDIEQLKAFDHVSCSFSPALFVAATGDDFILPHHAQELHEAYQGEKELHMVPGDHNSARPEACRRKAALFLCRTFHDSRLDHLLEMHGSGLYDIFSGAVPKHQPAHRGGDADGDEDGAAVCQQMQVFPSLRRMILLRQHRCRRPFVARTAIKLLQEQSEAGFFLRLQPAVDADRLQGLPHMLVLTVSCSALIVSRVCDDALETMAAGAGIPVRESRSLVVGMDRAGRLHLQLGEEVSVEVDVGATFRQEVTLWLMLLAGQTTFGVLAVEDGEATLRENLGDVVLRTRHLGGSVTPSLPTKLPRGDSGLTAPRMNSPVASARSARNTGGGGAGSGGVGGGELTRAQVKAQCGQRPEILVGWRVRVPSIGEGVIVGIRKRWGRATQHHLSTGTAAAAAAAGAANGVPGAAPSRAKLATVVLRRKDSQRRRRRGLEFEVLDREF